MPRESGSSQFDRHGLSVFLRLHPTARIDDVKYDILLKASRISLWSPLKIPLYLLLLLLAYLPPYVKSPLRTLPFHFAWSKAPCSVTFATAFMSSSLTQSTHRLLGLSLPLTPAPICCVLCPAYSSFLRGTSPNHLNRLSLSFSLSSPIFSGLLNLYVQASVSVCIIIHFHASHRFRFASFSALFPLATPKIRCIPYFKCNSYQKQSLALWFERYDCMRT